MKVREIRAEWKRVDEVAETVGVPPIDLEMLKLGARMEIATQLAELNERLEHRDDRGAPLGPTRIPKRQMRKKLRPR